MPSSGTQILIGGVVLAAGLLAGLGSPLRIGLGAGATGAMVQIDLTRTVKDTPPAKSLTHDSGLSSSGSDRADHDSGDNDSLPRNGADDRAGRDASNGPGA